MIYIIFSYDIDSVIFRMLDLCIRSIGDSAFHYTKIHTFSTTLEYLHCP